MKNTSRLTVYALNVIAVIALALLFHPGQALVSIYWALAFWTLLGLDAIKTRGEDLRLADRFCGYIFAAPFILVARGLELAPARMTR